MRDAAADLMQKRMRKSLSPASFFGSLIEAKEFAEKLPGRVNRILDTVAANDLKVKVEVDALDEKLLMEGFQKVANRITMGLVLARADRGCLADPADGRSAGLSVAGAPLVPGRRCGGYGSGGVDIPLG